MAGVPGMCSWLMREEKRMDLNGTELRLDGRDAETKWCQAHKLWSVFATRLLWSAMVGCLEDSCCLATLLSPFRCNIRGGDPLVSTHWQEKGELGDKGGYNNCCGDGELVSILMLCRDVGWADDEGDGHPVLVPTRVLKRYMECECVKILDQTFSALVKVCW